MRHNFELLMKDLWLALEHPGKDRSVMGTAIYGVRRFFPELMRDPVKLRQVLEFVLALRSSDAPGRQVEERELMECLSSLAWQCAGGLEDGECPRFAEFGMIGTAPEEFRPMLHALRGLHDFALGCFEFKRPRDSFGGTRRGLAFEILGHVGRMVDLPEGVAMARRSLKKAKSPEPAKAAEFLRQYFTGRSLSRDDAIVGELLSLAATTDSRSTAFSALDALVETGVISEFMAMDRLSDWKSKHR